VAVFSLSTVYAHYFSGTARPKISSYSSMIGLVITLILGIWLIPLYEKTGVAITASLSFFSSGLYLIIMMLREPGASLTDMLPNKNDLLKMIDFLKFK
jgi:O-antigen/teichoic acid export membrane protein